MKVNTLKTSVLCVSDATSFRPVAFLEAADGEILESAPGGRMKILGFVFGDTPSVRPHVESVIKKIRQRYWTLFNLKKHGFTQEELVTVYKTMIRPVADYCDIVYHSLMTDDLDEALENMQNMALRCIFGPKISARKMRKLAGITTLRERRISHCDTFAQKCLDSTRFQEWFPLKSGRRSARSEKSEKYVESFARCESCLLYTSPSPRD